MKNLFIALIFAFLPLFLFSQDDKTDYSMLEFVFIDVEDGMEEEFVEAVKMHNEKHHSGAHQATLIYIATGKNAGTYVWEMGPMTMTDMDSRPADEAHDSDWDNNVVPKINKVHSVEYWTRDDDISFSTGEDYDKFEVWWLDIESGQWDRFEAFMDKVVKVHKKKGDVSISVWYNRYAQNDGREAALVFPFNNWSDYDADDWSIDDEYDAEFGEGAWELALEDWRQSVASVVEEVWDTVE